MTDGQYEEDEKPPRNKVSRKENRKHDELSGVLTSPERALSASSESDARIHPGINDIGSNQADDVGEGAEKNHRAYDGKVLCPQSVDRIAPQTGNAEEAFHNEASHKSIGITATDEVMMGSAAFRST